MSNDISLGRSTLITEPPGVSTLKVVLNVYKLETPLTILELSTKLKEKLDGCTEVVNVFCYC